MSEPHLRARRLLAAGMAALALVLGACDPEPGGPDQSGSVPPQAGLSVEILQWACGHEVARTAETAIKAQGEFCLVEMDLLNEGSSDVNLQPECQFLLDAEGSRFPPDQEVLVLDELALQAFGAPIPPGSEVENTALYFDVPQGASPVSLEMHATCEGPDIFIPLDPALNLQESGS